MKNSQKEYKHWSDSQLDDPQNLYKRGSFQEVELYSSFQRDKQNFQLCGIHRNNKLEMKNTNQFGLVRLA